jgi:hypothetical protein
MSYAMPTAAGARGAAATRRHTRSGKQQSSNKEVSSSTVQLQLPPKSSAAVTPAQEYGVLVRMFQHLQQQLVWLQSKKLCLQETLSIAVAWQQGIAASAAVPAGLQSRA